MVTVSTGKARWQSPSSRADQIFGHKSRPFQICSPGPARNQALDELTVARTSGFSRSSRPREDRGWRRWTQMPPCVRPPHALDSNHSRLRPHHAGHAFSAAPSQPEPAAPTRSAEPRRSRPVRFDGSLRPPEFGLDASGERRTGTDAIRVIADFSPLAATACHLGQSVHAGPALKEGAGTRCPARISRKSRCTPPGPST
jgi:hypothetical protein